MSDAVFADLAITSLYADSRAFQFCLSVQTVHRATLQELELGRPGCEAHLVLTTLDQRDLGEILLLRWFAVHGEWWASQSRPL